MAPPPEYDKEPKAPDKNVTTQCSDDSKVLYNIVKDQQTNQDHKVSTTTGSAEAENKHVETLDDGQLRALLDEAITYKCPKDREGKSSLFKELLHEVEQDEQACEAACEAACSAARGLSAGRAARRGAGGAGAGAGARGRRELQSNSLQDLVAAMAAEPAGLPAPRRPRAAPPAQVSARAHHGGSLPSGVDTSSLLSEEPQPRGGYLATVRCVNPPPLAERRVSASDANPPADVDLLARRSKPTFPMTYTARATLEIGSGSVCSGRAVTTTTASNQVRTTPVTAPRHPRAPRPPPAAALAAHTADPGQAKLMNAIRPSGRDAKRNVGGGGPDDDVPPPAPDGARNGVPRGQKQTNDPKRAKQNSGNRNVAARNDPVGQQWVNSVHNWYDGLSDIQPLLNSFMSTNAPAKIFERSAPVSPVKSQVPKTSKEMTEVEHQTDTAPYDLSHDQTKFKNKVWEMNTIPKKLSETKLENSCSDMYDENVTMLRNKYREQVGYDLVPPRLLPLNPTSFRKTTIGTESSSLFHSNISSTNHPPSINETNKKNTFHKSNSSKHNESASKMLDGESNLHESSTESYNELNCKNQSHRSARNKLSKKLAPENTSMELHCIESSKVQMEKPANVGMPKLSTIIHDNKNISKKRTITNAEPRENEIELADIPPCNDVRNSDDFLQHLAAQQRFLENLENDSHNSSNLESRASERRDKLRMDKIKDEERVKDEFNSEKFEVELGTAQENVVELNENSSENREKFIFAELPNNAYVFLTLPQSFFSLTQKSNNNVSLKEIEDNNNVTPYTSGSNNTLAKKSKKKNKRKKESHTPEKNSMKHNAVNKSALKLLLYSDSTDKSTSGMSLNCNKEVDSAIPFTCITTPEVVASCNTTSSTSSAVAVDPKPLQLGSCYRAVASLTGEWSPAAAPAQPPAAEPPAPEPAPAPAPALTNAAHLQPRGAGGGGSGGFNGLPLSRPGYGATASTASTATDEYKKSLDENGNAVQGFSSPLSGSSQHKKPRRKKSSKNETVIKSHQIDGYQGNKDLNEVLRFIESNADSARGHKLGRAKHKDDSDDKAGKKRSSERRKDKENKVKRASSLEELSRTKLEDLTDQPAPRPPRVPPAAAPHERRSWGDDARDAFYFRDASDNNPTPAPAPALAATPDPAPDAAAAAAELTDFQTVTKKRKPRRRTDDAAADPPRRTRAPSPRRAPSDRSNDSNDDLDSVHSLPADAPPRPPPAPHASYADIARTRHNIPDLIESCNFYAEGETAAVPPADGDYPALATRGGGGGGGRTRDKPGAPPPRVRKERPEPAAAPPPAPAPAPDVVADRRPPVVLLDSSARPRDMDGITFGFDVNEQLLGAAPRRARCDLVREAADAAEAGAVAVRAGAAALRYVPPRAPPPLQLLQLVDYVGAAWEDVVRCGGKARYFSE